MRQAAVEGDARLVLCVREDIMLPSMYKTHICFGFCFCVCVGGGGVRGGWGGDGEGSQCFISSGYNYYHSNTFLATFSALFPDLDKYRHTSQR